MRFKKIQSLLVAVAMGIAAVVISIGLLEMSPAQAREPEVVPIAQGPSQDTIGFTVFFTDPAEIQITDLSGNIVGEGTHGGKVRCTGNNCSQKTAMYFTIVLTDPAVLGTMYEYKFTTRQAFDPEEERAVVEGVGRISSRRGQKEKFSFTATFQNNRDGTVLVRYEASTPDASFIIPNALGRFAIRTR